MPQTYVINDLNRAETVGTFYELQKPNQKEFRTETVMKRKSYKLYVEGKGYHNLFNSWINKKDIA